MANSSWDIELIIKLVRIIPNYVFSNQLLGYEVSPTRYTRCDNSSGTVLYVRISSSLPLRIFTHKLSLIIRLIELPITCDQTQNPSFSPASSVLILLSQSIKAQFSFHYKILRPKREESTCRNYFLSVAFMLHKINGWKWSSNRLVQVFLERCGEGGKWVSFWWWKVVYVRFYILL